MRNLGINLGGLCNCSVQEYIKMISDAGFNCFFSIIDERFPLDVISEDAAKYGLDFECIHAPFRGFTNDIWDATDGSVGDDAIQILLDCVDTCQRYGVGKMVVHLSSGDRAPMVNDKGIDRFSRLVEHAGERDITIAFENQRKIGNLAVLLEKYKDCKNVGFCLDTGHQYCFTPGKDYLAMFGSQLIYTHLHDNMGILNKDLHMLPFDGVVDFHKIANDINKHGYKGSLTLEVQYAKSGAYNDITIDQFVEKAYERACRFKRLVDGE